MTQMCEKVEGLAEYIFFTRDYLQHVSGIPLQEIKIAYRLLKVFLQELSEENLPKMPRKHQRVKPIFVGSPVRLPTEGGVMKHKPQPKTKGDETFLAPPKNPGDPTHCKNNPELFNYLNDMAMSKNQERVPVSICLTQKQHDKPKLTTTYNK